MVKTISAAKDRKIKRQVAEDRIKHATSVALEAKRVMEVAQQRVREAETDYQLALADHEEAERELIYEKKSCAEWLALT